MSADGEQVAVFGGSFNPPHIAHVLAAAWALASVPLARLLVVPTYRHPFQKAMAPYEHRLRLCELAFAELRGVEVSRIEAELGGESLTLRTLEELQRRLPGVRLRLVIGSDLLAETSKWHAFDRVAALDLLVGYALDGSKRNSTSGGDSPLGNMIATAMWLRLGIQTDFSLTNTTGIRADLVPGPITVEQMYNIFPFDNAITKMQVSGFEVQELFDFVARRSAGRGCKSQVQIAGARITIDCAKQLTPEVPPGVATGIYIGSAIDQSTSKPYTCKSDADCPGSGDKCSTGDDCASGLCLGGACKYPGSCALDSNTCWQAITPISSYELATSDYLAGGGSGFRVLQRNTTQLNTGVQQRDALIDYIRAGKPCGADDSGKLKGCSKDGDCASVGVGYACACPEAVHDDATCSTDAKSSCGAGQCVLAQCRTDVAAFQRKTCEAAPNALVRKQCEAALSPCAAAGETCKFLACVDRKIGNYSDGRLQMVGQ